MYFSKNTFNLISIAMDLDAVLESLLTERTSEVGGIINEKHGVGDVVFLTELGEKFSANRDRVRREEPNVEDSVGFRIDCGVQPVLFIIDLDRLLIDRNSIRAFATGWLYIGLLNPVMNGDPTSLDTQFLK